MHEIDEEKRDNLPTKVNDLVREIIDYIERLMVKEKSLDTFVQLFSKEVDSIIIKQINEGNKYGGGKLRVIWRSQKSFDCLFEVYFITRSGEAIEISGGRDNIRKNSISFKDWDELEGKREIVYEIEEPNL